MNKILMTTSVAAALAVLAGAAAAAQSAPGMERAPRVLRADTDADGRISRSEFVEARVTRLTAVDADRDGSVSADEVRSAREARRDERASTRFERADTDGNGALTQQEFLSALGERGPHMGQGRQGRDGERARWRGARERGATRGPVSIADARARTDQAFARIDQDADGYLTAQEGRLARGDMREALRDRREARMSARAAGTPSPSTAPSE